ncbi:MAG: alpha-E domain-containing protein [Planctomycetota bacterium]
MLLSRVANSIYWMSRYMERAENVARFIDVNLQLSLEQSTAPDAPWQALVAVTGDQEDFEKRYDRADRQTVMRYLTLDRGYPSSIARCVSAARDNARTVRDVIPYEMWQQINALHITVKDAADDAIHSDRPVGFYRAVKEASLLFAAITDATMSHNVAFEFCKLGRLIERADQTSRVLDVKYFLLLPDPSDVGGAMDVVQWAALLRSVGALEMYRQAHGVITPRNVAAFLMLDPEFPRSVTHCLLQTEGCLAHIVGPGSPRTVDVQRRLGRLRSQLEYGDIDEIIHGGMHETIDRLQQDLNDIDNAVNAAFFEFQPEAEPALGPASVQ